MFGYNDLIVDPRNLIWLKSNTNLVSMDITHCLQHPAQINTNGIVSSGGYRDLIPFMGKLAITFGVNVIFLEVHDNPDGALCDSQTQYNINNLQELFNFILPQNNKN